MIYRVNNETDVKGYLLHIKTLSMPVCINTGSSVYYSDILFFCDKNLSNLGESWPPMWYWRTTKRTTARRWSIKQVATFSLSTFYRKRVIELFVIRNRRHHTNYLKVIVVILIVFLRNGHMGAAIIIRTTVVSRHADHIQPETLDRKTVKTKRRTLPLRKWRKGKPTDFEMVSEKLKF